MVNTIRSIYRMIFDHAICSGAAQYNPVTSVRLPRSLKKGKRTVPILSILRQPLQDRKASSRNFDTKITVLIFVYIRKNHDFSIFLCEIQSRCGV
ncbi:MAG: hypothetical protein MR426_12650 [Clostridiales bacterium]|nr:hypothetical protein [Clostridiales bacterium]